MNTLLISYDLIGTSETSTDYKHLIQAIKAYSNWAKPLKSVWVIRTPKDAETVRNELLPFIDVNDRLLVFDVTDKPWASYKLSEGVVAWLQR